MTYTEELIESYEEVTAALHNSFIADILPDMPKPLEEMTAEDLRQYQDDIARRFADIKTATTNALDALEGMACLLKC